MFKLPEAFLTANFPAGARELVFGILVDENIDGVIDRTYNMGAASRNPDVRIHEDRQVVNFFGCGATPDTQCATVGFEDFFGGGDNDFNDHVFGFEGQFVIPTPGLGALVLLGVGLLGLAPTDWRRWRRERRALSSRLRFRGAGTVRRP